MPDDIQRKRKRRSRNSTFFGILSIERQKMGLSQQEVAEAINFSQPHVSAVERGRTADALFLYRAGKLFKVPSLGQFFEDYVKERFERIPATIKAAQKKHQLIIAAQANIEEPESDPPPSTSPDSSTDQRIDADSETQTPEL